MSTGAVGDKGILEARKGRETQEYEDFLYLETTSTSEGFVLRVNLLAVAPASSCGETGVQRWVIYRKNWRGGIKILSQWHKHCNEIFFSGRIWRL